MPGYHVKPTCLCNERPEGRTISTLVVHSMHAPACVGRELDLEACWSELERWQVSAHYLIGPDGEVWEMVAPEKRAWHAGVSRMPDWAGGTEGVNDFSIGVELLATETSGFTAEQYQSLASLTSELLSRFGICYVVGHDEIAQPPGRKTDPGPLFDWECYRSQLSAADLKRLSFGR